jgi:hypothetical protein
VQRHDGDDDASHQKWIFLFFRLLWGVPLNRHPTRCFSSRPSLKKSNISFLFIHWHDLRWRHAHFVPFSPSAPEIPQQLTWSSCCVLRKKECIGLYVYNNPGMFIYFDYLLNFASETSFSYTHAGCVVGGYFTHTMNWRM